MSKTTKNAVTTFDRTTCRMISKRVEETLAALATELGVKISARGGSFSPNAYTLKIEVATIAEDGSVNTRAAEEFKHYAKLLGLEADDLGKSFVHRGKTYRITGLRPRSGKYPVLAEGPNNKPVCFPVADVLRLLRPGTPASRTARHIEDTEPSGIY